MSIAGAAQSHVAFLFQHARDSIFLTPLLKKSSGSLIQNHWVGILEQNGVLAAVG